MVRRLKKRDDGSQIRPPAARRGRAGGGGGVFATHSVQASCYQVRLRPRVIFLKARTPTPQASYRNPTWGLDVVTPQGDISPPRSDVGAAIQGSEHQRSRAASPPA